MNGEATQNDFEAHLAVFDENRRKLEIFRDQLLSPLQGSEELEDHVHSFKSRVKDRNHLLEKLERKKRQAEEGGEQFDITPENLLVEISDLVGIRILHLYTRQIQEIDRLLKQIFEEWEFQLVEGPFARTWDDESREFFTGCGIEIQTSPSMYTSVHYVVSTGSRAPLTCEIQVRTLMEEVWGEVDHALNYPIESDVLALREQLKVLARVTSSATRLVDSIFLTAGEHPEKM